MAEKDYFDADSYFTAKGMTFNGLNEDGSAKVTLDTGEEARVDIRSMLKREGLDPNMEIDYNNPNSPLNESPVGLMDRLKLSLGNTKGGVKYLREKYQDASVLDDGSLTVKDNGVWKRVDLDGLGDDTGWKASEIIGDLLDVTGDVAIAGGSLAATVGTGGMAAIPLGAAGAAGASAAKGVLGRMVGTYDATPEEVLKDIALDAALGAVGEGVALGAAKMVGPALKRGFAKLSQAGEVTQDTLAKGFAALDPETGAGTYRTMFREGPEVLKELEAAMTAADNLATQRGAGVGASLAQNATPTELAGKVLYDRMKQTARPLIEDVQTKLSNFYGNKIDEIVATQIKTELPKIQQAVRQNGSQISTQLEKFLNDIGLLTKGAKVTTSPTRVAPISANTVSAPKTVIKNQLRERIRPQDLMAWANKRGEVLTPPLARKMTAQLENMRAFASGLSKAGISEPRDIVKLMKLSKQMEDLLEVLPMDQREVLKNMAGGALQNIDNAVGSTLGKGFNQEYNTLRGTYRELKGNTQKLLGGLDSKGSSVNFDDVAARLIERFRETQKTGATQSKAEAHAIIESLKMIDPVAAQQLNKLARQNAAAALGGYKAVEALTLTGAMARTGALAARKVGIPAAMSWTKLQRKANLKSFVGSGGYQMARDAAALIKKGGTRMMERPEELGAALTALISAQQYKDVPK